jgi:hypothetical protein
MNSKAWITWDKVEMVSFSTAKQEVEYYRLAQQIRVINRCQDSRDPVQREGYYAAYEQARNILDQKGIYSLYDFYRALREYLQLPIEDAMVSDNPIIRAVAMFDRRLGKRRLCQIDLSSTEHPLVRQFYELRCEAEGIEVKK